MSSEQGVTTFGQILEARLRPLLTAPQQARITAILAGQDAPSFGVAIRVLYQELADESPAVATLLARMLVDSFGGGLEDLKREEQRRASIEQADRLDNVEQPSTYYRLRRLGLWNRQEALDACGLTLDRMETLDSFRVQPGLPCLAEALAAVSRWAEGKVALCTLSGPPGCGKTHLLTAAVRALVDRAAYVLYLDERRLIDQSRRAIRDHTVEAWKYEVSNVPYLVLDDLGASSASDYDRAVLDEIVDERWSNRRYTLIATNLTSAQLPARLVSRLGDVKWGVQVSIAAPDGRRERWWETV